MNLPPDEATDAGLESPAAGCGPEPAAGRGPEPVAGRAPEPVQIDRQQLDEIFGDLLPDTTGDERDPGSPDGQYSERWYRENRPPHHGG